MLDEREATDLIRTSLETGLGSCDNYRGGDRALAEASTDGVPEAENAFTFTLNDGTKFVVTIIKIEEGA